MVKNGKVCATNSTTHPERHEMKPRKAILRINKDKDDILSTTKEEAPYDKTNKHHKETIDEEDEHINELEDKQKIRAFLKVRKARLVEKVKKKIDDTTATMPEDLPVVKHRSRTKEGYYIYTPDELKMGLPGSGMTDKCPFDCDCCY